ncbi:MAG: NUDIX domain-containing protein [Pyrinomonadaceae bacterium]
MQWRDPKLAAGVLVAREGRILLVQRNHEPGMGRWSFPSGFVDRGEVVEEAAAREALEEAGVRVEILQLLGVFSERGHPVVFVVYEARTSDVPAPGPEALAVDFFAPGELPPLAFDHDKHIIDTWMRLRSISE